MAMHQSVLYLISYDIADPKRLVRIHRLLKKQGLPVQYSVFIAALTTLQLNRLLEAFKQVMDCREDDIRCYALPTNIECKHIGNQIFPDDVMLFSKGFNHLFV